MIEDWKRCGAGKGGRKFAMRRVVVLADGNRLFGTVTAGEWTLRVLDAKTRKYKIVGSGKFQGPLRLGAWDADWKIDKVVDEVELAVAAQVGTQPLDLESSKALWKKMTGAQREWIRTAYKAGGSYGYGGRGQGVALPDRTMLPG